MPLPKYELGQSETLHVDLLIYARSGGGKTLLASTAPGLQYLATPDPTGHKTYPYKVDGVVINQLETLRDVIRGFREGGHGYRTLVIDGLWAIHDLFVREVGQYFHEKQGAKDPDLLPIQGRMKITNQFKAFLRAAVDLTQLENPKDRVHVIFTTLEERIKEDDDAPFSIRPLLGTKNLNEIIPAFFSTIGYVRPKGGALDNGTPDPSREALFIEHAGILARDRTGLFPHYVTGNPINLSEYLK